MVNLLLKINLDEPEQTIALGAFGVGSEEKEKFDY